MRRALRELSARDPDLARILSEHGPPQWWEREEGFATLVFIILEQMVSLASARAAYERLLAAVAPSPLTPESFLALDGDALRRAGFSRQKADYCRRLAVEVSEGRLDIPALARMSDEGVRAELTKIKGVGPWTADIYLLRALLRPDAWPAGDLALQIAAQEAKRLPARPTAAQLEALGQQWRPWRAVAARLLWNLYLNR